ncbi:hypothetical protein [Pseudomonas sp.]|uniref:hypothetical protein n=1 Tax=Pseudomonas sp. TaxID=306 RepID=UPI003C69E5D7
MPEATCGECGAAEPSWNAQNVTEPLSTNLLNEIEKRDAEIASLRAALKKCADKLERCAIASLTLPEYAALAVHEFRIFEQSARKE